MPSNDHPVFKFTEHPGPSLTFSDLKPGDVFNWLDEKKGAPRMLKLDTYSYTQGWQPTYGGWGVYNAHKSSPSGSVTPVRRLGHIELYLDRI